VKIGIIAAMPGELKALVRHVPKLPVVRGSGIAMWEWERGELEVVAVCAGMGAAAARRAFTAAEYTGSLDEVLSIGWAGALTEAAKVGECYIPAEVIDAQTGERFELGSDGERCVTTVHVADAAEKRRLAETYGAKLVDMEAATVARLAQMRGIPMRCFKAVSDGVDADLPDLNPYIDEMGKLRMAGFLGAVALRPQSWGALLQLGRNSSKAANALAEVVGAYLETMSNE
jgi:adenosylhomocysteine nucleosidase